MKRNRKPSKTVRAKIFFARLKYILPFVCALLVLIVCVIPCVEFRNDDKAKEPQSILGNASLAAESYKKVLAGDAGDYEEVDIALAKDTRLGVILLHVSLWGALILSFALLCFALWVWRYPAGTIEGDRARVWARFFLPGRWLHFLITLLPIVPTVYPYYLINRFAEYYRVKPSTSPDAKPEYYEYSIVTHGINPLVFAAVLAALAVVVFLIAADWEKVYGVDLFTYYVREDDSAKTEE